MNIHNDKAITDHLKNLASRDALRLSVHAHQRMVEKNISYDSVRESLTNGKIIENYPEFERGPCCLVCGQTEDREFLHVVCTTSGEISIIITVYEPKPPKWETPFQRRQKK